VLLTAIALLGAGCDTSVAPTQPVSIPTTIATERPSPTASPSPTPTPSPTPSPSPTPTPSPTEAGPVGLISACPGKTPTSHAVGRAIQGQSRNWSGYVATGAQGFNCVEAIWVQPAVQCRGTSTQSAVYWVGLGGYGQRALVQIGTESTCIGGEALAAAWHESLPRERFSIRAPLTIAVGDRIWAQARWLSGSRYQLTLADLTTQKRFSIRVTNTTLKRTSADWIVEAPTGGCPNHCRTLKMPNFKTFRFRAAAVSVAGFRRQVDAASFSHVLEAMVSTAGAIRAEVTSTTADGTSFAVRWRRP
jgi:hypothetical protein